MLRTQPIARLRVTKITFKPKKIVLSQKSSISVDYCVEYNGKYIRDKQLASIVLEVTDRKLRVRENRSLVGNKKSDEKNIELKANQEKCSTNKESFVLTINVSITSR